MKGTAYSPMTGVDQGLQLIANKEPLGSGRPRTLPQAKKQKTDYIINKVIQALNILELFHGDVDELGLTELSTRLSLKENSVRMLLATLKSRNYIEQNSSNNNYRLGFKNLELAQAVLRQIDLYRASLPVLSSIALQCGETAAVAVLRKSHVIELEAVQSEHPVQVVSRVGVHLPVHCTAAGKAMAAFKTPGELDSLLGEGAGELRLKLAQVVERGYAVDDEEFDRDVRSVAAAIRDHLGVVVGAVVITGPSCRISLGRLVGEMAGLVQKGALEISLRLGFKGGESETVGELPVSAAKAGRPKKARPLAPPREQKIVDRPRAA